jgi:DNA-binding transcriptional LysR family regulator
MMNGVSAELRHLRAFLAVAEELSFSAAAERLFISQQALSRTIRQLERQLGTRLFDRTTRSVELTAAGRAMLGSAVRATAAADEAVAMAMRAANGAAWLPVRADVSSGGLRTPAEVLRALRRAEPQAVMELAEHGMPRSLELLRVGGLDVALGIANHAPPEIRTELIRREPVLVGMSRDHPLAALEDVPVRALEDVELLLPSDAGAPEWNEMVAAFCREAGFAPRRRPGATHGSAAAADVLREARCVTPTAAWVDPPGDLVFRPLVDPSPAIPWSLMWTDDGEQRADVRRVLEVARRLARAQGWSVGSAEGANVVDPG